MHYQSGHTFRLALALVLLGMFLGACGAPEALPSASERLGEYPTRDNIAQWESLWDGETWLVGWREDDASLPAPERMRQRIVDSILSSWDVRGDTRRALGSDLIRTLGVEGFDWGPRTGRRKNSTFDDNVAGVAIIRLPKTAMNRWARMLTPKNTAQWLRADAQMKALEPLTNAAWVEPNLLSELQTEEINKPPEMKTIGGMGDILSRIRADAAYEAAGLEFPDALGTITTTKPIQTVYVAVIDTGVDYKHPDLDGIVTNPRETANCVDDDGNGYIDDLYGIDAAYEKNVWNSELSKNCQPGANSQPDPGAADVSGAGVNCPVRGDGKNSRCGHGTHVAGIIAAKPGPQDSELIGVCPTCRIISIRASRVEKAKNDSGQDDLFNTAIDDAAQIRSLRYILSLRYANGAPLVSVVNMSIGRYYPSRSIGRMIHSLDEFDILVVAAAGNADTDTPNYPAAYGTVLSVCATGSSYDKTYFSNFGSWVDICAPGLGITSAWPGPNQYSASGANSHSADGTSQASPVVAGAAGFLKSMYPTFSSKQIVDLLKRFANASSLYGHPTNTLYQGIFPDDTQYFLLGAGFLDLGSAATQGAKCERSECTSFAASSEAFNNQVAGGCIVNTAAGTSSAVVSFFMSMPFMLLQAILALIWIRRRIREIP